MNRTPEDLETGARAIRAFYDEAVNLDSAMVAWAIASIMATEIFENSDSYGEALIGAEAYVGDVRLLLQSMYSGAPLGEVTH